MKRFTAILLLLATLATFACGTNEASDETTTSGGTTTTAPVVDPLDDNLPDVDYEGYEFRIIGADNDIPMLLVEEMTGSLVDDSVHKANQAVEERFGVKLKQVVLDSWMNGSAIRNSIQSGSDDFDLGVCHDITAGNLSLEGLFVDLRQLPHLDFDKPWWSDFTVDGLTVNGRMYIFSNYCGYNGLRGTKTMYVNLDKLGDYHIDSPYDMVRNREWTLDKVVSLTKDIYSDLDGDAKASREDFYGFAFTGLFYGWLENFGVEAYTKGADGRLTLTLNSPKTATIIEKVRSWLYGGNQGVYYKKSHVSLHDYDSYPVMFAEGNCLFTYGSLYVLIEELVKSNVNYGILPMPLLDDSQESYYGVCYDSPMWVPVTISDPERTGVILEAMSAEGYKNILPAYKDIALKNRYSTDSDSAEMLDIIFENRVLSLSYIYGGDSSAQRILNTLIPSDTLEFASYYASIESSELQKVADLNEFFSK